jgi:hypothetical protein
MYNMSSSFIFQYFFQSGIDKFQKFKLCFKSTYTVGFKKSLTIMLTNNPINT